MRHTTILKLAVLLSLLLPVSVSATAVQLTGSLMDAASNPISGTLTLQLPVANAVDTSTNKAVSPRFVTFPLTNGTLPAFATVVPNDVIQPAGTYYVVVAYDRSGAQVYSSNWVIPSSPSTFNMGQAIPTSIVTTNISYLTPIVASGNNNFTGSNTFSMPIVSTVSTGTAPFSIASTTPVANLTLSSATQVPAISLGSSGNGGVTGTLPITNGGTGATSTSQDYVFAGPTSGAGAPSFRALAAGDIPSLPASQITSGQLAIAQGGTGAATTSQNYVFAGPTSGSGAPSFRALASGDIPNNAANTSGTAAAANGLNSATTTVSVSSATAPINGQVLTATSGTAATWQTPSGGGGTGEASLTWCNAAPSGYTGCVFGSAVEYTAQVYLTNSHTLKRIFVNLDTQAGACTTPFTVALYDDTAGSAVSTLDIPNNVSTVDSGSLSVAMTAGHRFSLHVTVTGVNCNSNTPRGWFSATYQ